MEWGSKRMAKNAGFAMTVALNKENCDEKAELPGCNKHFGDAYRGDGRHRSRPSLANIGYSQNSTPYYIPPK
jgi:hypothetical protein